MGCGYQNYSKRKQERREECQKHESSTAIRSSSNHSPPCISISCYPPDCAAFSPKDHQRLSRQEVARLAGRWMASILDRSGISGGEIRRNGLVQRVLDAVLVHACCCRSTARCSHQSHVAKNVAADILLSFTHLRTRGDVEHAPIWTRVAGRYFLEPQHLCM